MRRFLGFRVLVLVFLGSVVAAPRVGRATAGAELSPQVGEVLQVLITTAELVVGQNSFVFGLLKEHQLLQDAHAVVRVYALQGQQGQLQTEVPAPYARLEVVEQGNRVHVHPDGTRHVHHEETDMRGIYVAQVPFERPGTWGLEVLATQDNGSTEMSRFTVNVLAAPYTPALGTPAPRSHNLIASDVTDLRHIDTSDPPDPRLHQVRIADAIAQGKPQVIVFATPKFCTSRVCGPVVDIVRLLLPTYGDRVVFTHQEIWQDFATQRVSPTVEEWHLQSEPWIFVVDGKGIIRAKFEGLTTTREIAAALQQILEPR
ncbi:MAG TPA: hypothetical protein VLQ80_03020 [Candidatus Saccharimonadia bacterium]|nr:hypothetical protein [Candidatus Saccharimonadia bacterium]